MKKAKIIALSATIAVLTAGGTIAAYAAESTPADPADNSAYSYIAGQAKGSQYENADGAPDTADKSGFGFNIGTQAHGQSTDPADNSAYSYIAGQAKGSRYENADGAPDTADKSGFSFNIGKE